MNADFAFTVPWEGLLNKPAFFPTAPVLIGDVLAPGSLFGQVPVWNGRKLVMTTLSGGVSPVPGAGYKGATTITTLGVIVTGTWHGSPITDEYIASAAAWNAKAPPGAYITALTGDVTAVGPGSAVALLGAAINFAGKTMTGGTFNATNLAASVGLGIGNTAPSYSIDVTQAGANARIFDTLGGGAALVLESRNAGVAGQAGISSSGTLKVSAGGVDVGLLSSTILNWYKPTVIRTNTSALPAGLAGTIFQLGSADGTNTRFFLDGFGAAPAINFRRSGGTNAAKTQSMNGNILGQIGAYGYGATGYGSNSKSFINFTASENWTDTAQGTLAEIYVTPNGSTTAALVASLSSSGLAVTGKISGNLGAAGTAFSVTDSINDFQVVFAAGVAARLFNSSGTGISIRNSANAVDVALFTNSAISLNQPTTVTGVLAATSIQNTPIGSVTPSTGVFSAVTVSSATRPAFTILTAGETAEGRFFRTVSGQHALANNLYFDGAAWQRDDVAASGQLVNMSSGSSAVGFFFASAGANPATLTQGGLVTATGFQGAIGATTPSTGAFTTLSTTSDWQILVNTGRGILDSAGNRVMSVVIGTTSFNIGGTTIVAITSAGEQVAGDISLSGELKLGNAQYISWGGVQAFRYLAAGTKLQAFANLEVNGALNATSIQNTPIGSVTPSTGAFTNISATSGAVIGTGATVNAILQLGGQTNAFPAVRYENASTVGLVLADASAYASLKALNATLTGLLTAAGINSTPVGATTPSTGAFTTLSAYNSAGYGQSISDGLSGGAFIIKKAGVAYGTLYGNDTNTVLDSAGSSNLIFQVGGVTKGYFTALGLVLSNALPIASGGTGQITANAALNALLPSQGGNANKILKTDGTNTSWATAAVEYRVNVKDYGAVGDGVTDDTAAILAAFEACRTTGGIDRVIMTNFGTAYATAPTMTFVGGFGSGQVATALLASAGTEVGSVVIGTRGTGHKILGKRCNITSGVTTIACTDTSGLVNGVSANHYTIPAHTTVVSFVANTSVTLSAAPTASNAFAQVAFGIPYPVFTSGTGSGADGDVIVGNGVVLYFPPGTYAMNGKEVTGFHNLTIEGYGATLFINDTGTGFVIDEFCRSLTVRGLRIEHSLTNYFGRPGASRGGGCAMRVAGDLITITDCSAYNSPEFGIVFTRDRTTGTSMYGCKLVRWTSQQTAGDGIHVSNGCGGLDIIDPTVLSSGDDCIGIVADYGVGNEPKNISVSGYNLSQGGFRGIAVLGATNVRIGSGSIRYCEGYGIDVEANAGVNNTDISLIGFHITNIGSGGNGPSFSNRHGVIFLDVTGGKVGPGFIDNVTGYGYYFDRDTDVQCDNVMAMNCGLGDFALGGTLTRFSQLYRASGALKYRGDGGTVTTVAAS